MKSNFLRTTIVAGLFGLSSGPLLAENVQKTVHEFEIGKGAQVFINQLIKQPEAQEFLLKLAKESLQGGRDTVKEVRMTIKEITQLIKEGGPVADKIIEKIGSEQRKDEIAKAEIRLKLEQEKQQTDRRKTELDHKLHNSYGGISIRVFNAVKWPILIGFMACVLLVNLDDQNKNTKALGEHNKILKSLTKKITEIEKKSSK